MKVIWIIGLLVSPLAQAVGTIQCAGFSSLYDERVSIAVDDSWRQLRLETRQDGEELVVDSHILSVRSVAAPQDLPAYFACEDEKEDYDACRAKFESGLSKEEVATLTALLFVESWRRHPAFADSPNRPIYEKFPTLAVRRVEQLVIEEDLGTGATGLVNFYGDRGELLGRFFQTLEPIPCQ